MAVKHLTAGFPAWLACLMFSNDIEKPCDGDGCPVIQMDHSKETGDTDVICRTYDFFRLLFDRLYVVDLGCVALSAAQGDS
ncbi:hypothetical protein [Thalassospira xiamenensis]|uniref:hypothetical protein n=1 Tax=Thalassospira xiamenensis TaxID=220697 RepID=UPI0015F08667|nr:hypothetical protein [Thalassospira xiamenensis]